MTGPRPLRPGRYASLSHRFISPPGVHRLLSCLRDLLRVHGTLEDLYRAGLPPGTSDPREGLSRFLAAFRQAWGSPLPRQREFLFPDPRRGSACKRAHLFLRWVVRPDDGVDLGLWTAISPAQLTVPLDTHVARLSRSLGLTRRNRADGKMAEEVTASLRAVCPEDPVRYDFALARIGIEGRCTARRRGRCGDCELLEGCLAGKPPGPPPVSPGGSGSRGEGAPISGIAGVSGIGLQSTKFSHEPKRGTHGPEQAETR